MSNISTNCYFISILIINFKFRVCRSYCITLLLIGYFSSFYVEKVLHFSYITKKLYPYLAIIFALTIPSWKLPLLSAFSKLLVYPYRNMHMHPHTRSSTVFNGFNPLFQHPASQAWSFGWKHRFHYTARVSCVRASLKSKKDFESEIYSQNTQHILMCIHIVRSLYVYISFVFRAHNLYARVA